MDVQALIQQAARSSENPTGLSPESVRILTAHTTQNAIRGAEGVDAMELGEDVLLFIEMIDESGSMSSLRQTLIETYNKELAALRGSKAADNIVMSTWKFNHMVSLVSTFEKLEDVADFTDQVYNPGGETRLYDCLLEALVSAVAYSQHLFSQGLRMRVFLVALTDGQDNKSSARLAEVATVVTDLNQNPNFHLALVAFGNAAKGIAAQMRFMPEKVIEDTADPSSLRKALGQVSKSAINIGTQPPVTPGASQQPGSLWA